MVRGDLVNHGTHKEEEEKEAEEYKEDKEREWERGSMWPLLSFYIRVVSAKIF